MTFWGHFRGFSCNSGVLKVIVSYEVVKEIILVAGRVTEVFWVGFGGSKVFWGGWGGSKGVNSSPMGRFLPLGKSCTAPKLVPNTTLWFNWPSLTGYASLTQCIAMLDLWDPSKDPHKTTL